MTLFRPEVFQAKKNRWTGQIVLVRPFSLQFLTFFAVSLAAILVAFLIFGSYTNKTTVTGQLLPTTGVVRVYSQDMGVIAHQHVMNGDFVKKGDVLFTLSTSRNDNNGSIQARLLAEAELKKITIRTRNYYEKTCSCSRKNRTRKHGTPFSEPNATR